MSNLKMPTPVAKRWLNSVTMAWEFGDKGLSVAIPNEPLYTAEALRDVLEQAAMLFESQYNVVFTASTVQERIRALIKDIQ